ncbi:hypothetical protein EDD17DRAFT_396798 [Pisolithus thermaeus]|nr:hypothetical protein EDD17DRAFT_396798 [Pisolithus thermaeus]
MLPHAHQSIAISHRHLDISRKRYPLMDVSLSSSLPVPSSLASNGMGSSTPGVVSTASSGTETIGATSSTVETASSSSLDTRSSVPSSMPTEGTTSTGTRSPASSLASMSSNANSFTSTSSGFASSYSGTSFSSLALATSSFVVSPTQSTVDPSSTLTVASTSSFTLASFASSVGTSNSATVTTLLMSTASSESWSLGEISTLEMHTSTDTIEIPETVYTTVSPLTSAAYIPETSMYTVVSTLPGGAGTTTFTVTTSGVLSTAAGADAIGSDTSPGKIAAIVLGLVGAAVIVVLWIFCARRRHRKRERDAALLDSSRHLGPLDGEVFDDSEEPDYLRQSSNTGGPPVMEERYAGILAALHTGHGTGASTDGVYGSQRHQNGESDVDMAHSSSSTLPFHPLPSNDDALHIISLSPPPAAILSSRPSTSPPSTYVNPMMEPLRRSSPGPDAAAWLGGSGSCSVDALTRTHTGSEEPLLSAGILSYTQPLGGNKLGLGSAFGSAEGSVYSPSHCYDARSRTLSGSGSYAHTRSLASSSFDMLRSMSSQGALSGSHADHGFGSGGVRSVSSDSMGRKKHRHGFGSPPSSFKAWKERGSSVRNKVVTRGRVGQVLRTVSVGCWIGYGEWVIRPRQCHPQWRYLQRLERVTRTSMLRGLRAQEVKRFGLQRQRRYSHRSPRPRDLMSF